MDLNELFLSSLKDLSSAEKQLVKALPKMVKATVSPALRTAFQNHLEETKTHVSRIQQAFESLGAKPKSVLCKGMQGLVAEGAEHIEQDAGDVFGDLALLGAGQRVEHYEMAGYFSAISIAKTLGYGDAANLLVENLQDEQKASELLRKLSKSVLKEAAETNEQRGKRP
jgi:ferritin-like metal-binding protein YciE